MLTSVHRRLPAEPPRYATLLPWFGPLLCDTVDKENGPHLSIAGACDPSLGPALAALLVPVERGNGRLTSREKHGFVDGWAAPIAPDGRGRFKFPAPLDVRASGPTLLVLLYDQSAVASGLRLAGDFPESWDAQLDQLGYKGTSSKPAKIPSLPHRIAQEITFRVRRLLKQPAKKLEPGLIELAPIPPAPSEKITFAFGSCQYPPGFLDRRIAEASYERLAERWLDGGGEKRPSCLLLLGDQVYIDATAGLFDPVTQYDRYERPYERLFEMDPVRHVLRRLPLYAMLDDHEIEDNWQPGPGIGRDHPGLVAGRDGYLRYQRLAGPPQRDPSGDSREPLWYEFTCAGFPFFVADTRTERDPRNVENIASACIMSDTQFKALIAWLDRHKNAGLPMFIASPAAFLPRHWRAVQNGHRASALHSDGWDGYPFSFELLLAHIAAHAIPNVVFLSGDEHISFDCTAHLHRSGGSATQVRSIHSSALYAPFPFGNATQPYLAHDEKFDFHISGPSLYAGTYRCEVNTKFTPGDGFTLITAQRAGSGWSIVPEFDR